MRAIEPQRTGYALNPEDGVRSYYEVFGPDDAGRTVVLLPSWSLVHSRCWKFQVPYFARHGFRVVTFDGRGNGKSDRPTSGYGTTDYARDTLAVFDEASVERAAVVALSAGGRRAAQFAAEYPERVSHLILIAPAVRLDGDRRMGLDRFLNEPPDRDGWNKYTAVHWRENYPDFVEWFVGEIFSEPHSTKQFDDFAGWARETTGEILIATVLASATPRIAEFCAAVQCPTLIIHGDDDRIIPLANSERLASVIPGAKLVVFEGGGHAPQARDPVKTNLLIHDFLNHQPDELLECGIAYARA